MLGNKLITLLPLLSVVYAASIRLDVRQNNDNSNTTSGDPTSSTNSSSSSNSSSSVGPYGLSNGQCSNITLSIPVNLTLSNYTNLDNFYSNQSYITSQILEYTTAPSNWTSAHQSNSTFDLNRNFSIAGYFCEPKQGYKNGSALLNLVHGIGFDASYWNYALAPNYSFVKAAASWGYASFRYDRLGTGNSETPAGGFDVVRAQTEVVILEAILGKLRNGTEIGGRSWEKIVGVGHSYGSVQTQAVTKQSPQLLDGVVLTGFSTNSSNQPNYIQAAGYSIANRIFPQRLGDKPSTWLVTGSNASDITGFFYPPYYSEESFDLSRSTEQPVTLGSLVTVGAVGGEAINFTGPVQIVNGAKDFIFCSSNCWAEVEGGGDIPSAVKKLYPQAANFTSYIAKNTGHAITPHYSQPMVAGEIVRWIQEQGL